VVGDQQDFLCAKEAVMHLSGAALRTLGRAPSGASPPVGVEEVRRAVEAVVQAVDRKHAAVRATVRAAVAGRPDGAPADAAAAAAVAAAAQAFLRARSVDAAAPAYDGGVSPLARSQLRPGRSAGPSGPVSDGDGEAADGDSDDGPAEWFLLPGGPGRQQRPRGRSAQGGSGGGSRRRQSPPRQPRAGNRADERPGRAGRPNSPAPTRPGGR
jgi:hypothetical protein